MLRGSRRIDLVKFHKEHDFQDMYGEGSFCELSLLSLVAREQMGISSLLGSMKGKVSNGCLSATSNHLRNGLDANREVLVTGN